MDWVTKANKSSQRCENFVVCFEMCRVKEREKQINTTQNKHYIVFGVIVAPKCFRSVPQVTGRKARAFLVIPIGSSHSYFLFSSLDYILYINNKHMKLILYTNGNFVSKILLISTCKMQLCRNMSLLLFLLCFFCDFISCLVRGVCFNQPLK